jgi:hypothetical protein
VLPIWTEGTHVARALMDQAMPNHLVLPFKTFAAFAARTVLYGTVVRAQVRVNILVRTTTTLATSRKLLIQEMRT